MCTSIPLSVARSLDHILFRPRHRPLFQVFAANTGLGKTLLSAGLLHEAQSHVPDYDLHYLKPVQTGYPGDSDSRLVKTNAPAARVRDIFVFRDPVSPHLAARTVRKLANFFPNLFLGFDSRLCWVGKPHGVR